MVRPLVFVIDDDSVALTSVRSLLTAFDFEVRFFNSAEEFLAAHLHLEKGCLLSDLRLPGMSGLELHETLKLRGAVLPTILITGYADAEVVAKTLESGVDAILEKPIAPHALLAHLTAVIAPSEEP